MLPATCMPHTPDPEAFAIRLQERFGLWHASLSSSRFHNIISSYKRSIGRHDDLISFLIYDFPTHPRALAYSTGRMFLLLARRITEAVLRSESGQPLDEYHHDAIMMVASRLGVLCRTCSDRGTARCIFPTEAYVIPVVRIVRDALSPAGVPRRV